MKKSLEDSVLFSGLEPDDLKIVEETGHQVSIEKDAFVFFEGDPAEGFYVVLSGRIKVHKTSPDGKEQILLMAAAGDSFGEAALFSGKKYPASARAAEAAELISFSRTNFMALLKQNPTLAANMIARMSMLLHHLTRLVQQLSLEDISTRLASYLVDLIEEDTAGRKSTVILKDKKMVLASILGTIPETLSRAFARLSKQGIISVEGQQITVHDYDKLADLATGQKI